MAGDSLAGDLGEVPPKDVAVIAKAASEEATKWLKRNNVEAGAGTLAYAGTLLKLFRDLLDAPAQAALVEFAESALARGRAGLLAGKSYQRPPAEWAARGQGRETVHFGCLVKCNKLLGAPVEPLPPILEDLFSALEAAGVFGAAQRPDSVCVNVYEEGAWLPPHVDSDAFARPFCTVSLLSDHCVGFGTRVPPQEGGEPVYTEACRLELASGSAALERMARRRAAKALRRGRRQEGEGAEGGAEGGEGEEGDDAAETLRDG
ncbi:hypothetical protein EMIHUDRAFT_115083 [Emiliania huxleyi CCMP1516]|uniref:Alpha-ketoglutarate-dependent dioxygenase AlkB-like domain-containing protein n=2 Tax=Emiliania huxleyi TaxID=2903 RepID=A0A0D3JS11_EMIH1|nr:hypothetical protein EMIHUDRAFT_115083 [Emiliania huxleyi CCMP1516]EOD26296.1 hypothetical protein EMIHUDRAFT_115083 [Emiliania huxleyi CCMP1516]|eukprot:XP_005778725.1 hypothetical protein EMIHUDRAFT_115083 [Emiliania huxleyi CCMP1516]